jgi:hypothetical protein
VPSLLPFSTYIDAKSWIRYQTCYIARLVYQHVNGRGKAEPLPDPVPGHQPSLLLNSGHDLTKMRGPYIYHCPTTVVPSQSDTLQPTMLYLISLEEVSPKDKRLYLQVMMKLLVWYQSLNAYIQHVLTGLTLQSGAGQGS